MGFKQRFNLFYLQDKDKPNTIKEISELTGINESKLVRKYNDVLKFPYTYGFYDLDRPLQKKQFARIAVYKYAMEYKVKGPVFKLNQEIVVCEDGEEVVLDCGGNVINPHSINFNL